MGYIEVDGDGDRDNRREVIIDRTLGRGLGISVEEYDGEEGGTMICEIVAGGPAEEVRRATCLPSLRFKLAPLFVRWPS